MLSREEEIRARLREIHALKVRLNDRVMAKVTPVYEPSDEEKHYPLTKARIHERVLELAGRFSRAMAGKRPVLISPMNGALKTTAAIHDALSDIGFGYDFDTIQVSSYDGTRSTGSLKILSQHKIAVGERDVVIIDDVCDTGNTFYALRDYYLKKGARSVVLMTLVNKPQPRISELANPTYYGFEISKDAFLVGWGMDYAQIGRTHQDIVVVDETTLITAAEKVVLNEEDALNIELCQLLAEPTPVMTQAIAQGKTSSSHSGSPGNVPQALFAYNEAAATKQKTMAAVGLDGSTGYLATP